jgi:ElaA protein
MSRVLERDSDRGAALLLLHCRCDSSNQRVTGTAEVQVATFEELTPHVLYSIVKLRQDVFVVEQRCAYPDLDGRDSEPEARHLWICADGRVVSALRLLRDHDGSHRIGRLVTDADHRGQGHADALMRRAIALAGPPLVLSAQAHLAPWYQRLGFTVCGVAWVEDGIRHLPMQLG